MPPSIENIQFPIATKEGLKVWDIAFTHTYVNLISILLPFKKKQPCFKTWGLSTFPVEIFVQSIRILQWILKTKKCRLDQVD